MRGGLGAIPGHVTGVLQNMQSFRSKQCLCSSAVSLPSFPNFFKRSGWAGIADLILAVEDTEPELLDADRADLVPEEDEGAEDFDGCIRAALD